MGLQHVTVENLVDTRSNWNNQMLDWQINDIRKKIDSILPPQAELGNDKILWLGDNCGNFTIASTYALLCNHDIIDRNDIWKRIWRLVGAKL